jgi:hypothetical protein
MNRMPILSFDHSVKDISVNRIEGVCQYIKTAARKLPTFLNIVKNTVEIAALVAAGVFAPWIYYQYEAAREETKVDQALSLIQTFRPTIRYEEPILYFNVRTVSVVIGATNTTDYLLEVEAVLRDVISCEHRSSIVNNTLPVQAVIGPGGSEVFNVNIALDDEVPSGRYLAVVEYTAISPVARAFVEAYKIETETWRTAHAETYNENASRHGIEPAPPVKNATYVRLSSVVNFEVKDGLVARVGGYDCDRTTDSTILEQYVRDTGFNSRP